LNVDIGAVVNDGDIGAGEGGGIARRTKALDIRVLRSGIPRDANGYDSDTCKVLLGSFHTLLSNWMNMTREMRCDAQRKLPNSGG